MNTGKPILVGLTIAAAIASVLLSAAAHADPGPELGCAHSAAHICAPGNPDHIPAGCYDDAAAPVLQFIWPCHGWTPDAGRLDPTTGLVSYPPDHQADGDQTAPDQSNKDGKPKAPHVGRDELERLGADRALDHARIRPWRR